MAPESWLKIGLPAYPVLFTVFGVWLYWGDNPLPLLPPSIAFWGLVVLFYVFSHCYVVNKSYPLYLMIGATALWLVSSITSHNLGRFLLSKQYTGYVSVLTNKDFWTAVVCSVFASVIGLYHFFRWEPMIVAQIRTEEARIQSVRPEEE